jgi:two-component system cell cycle response regulator CtrA
MFPTWTSDRDALHREIAELRGKLDERDCQIMRLRQMLEPTIEFPTRWKLTGTEEKILSLLMFGGVKLRSSIVDLIYDNDVDEAKDRIIDVYIHRLRHALAKDGIEIKTVWSRGYKLEREAIARIKQICAGEAVAA